MISNNILYCKHKFKVYNLPLIQIMTMVTQDSIKEQVSGASLHYESGECSFLLAAPAISPPAHLMLPSYNFRTQISALT